jgi:hypothetical protein
MNTKNLRKKEGAIVWHKNKLKRVTSQNVGKDYIVLDDLIKIKKSSVKLAKIGDSVEFKDLSILPKRCSEKSDMKITYFRFNGIVGTDKDLYPTSDGSAYSHFRRTS